MSTIIHLYFFCVCVRERHVYVPMYMHVYVGACAHANGCGGRRLQLGVFSSLDCFLPYFLRQCPSLDSLLMSKLRLLRLTRSSSPGTKHFPVWRRHSPSPPLLFLCKYSGLNCFQSAFLFCKNLSHFLFRTCELFWYQEWRSKNT